MGIKSKRHTHHGQPPHVSPVAALEQKVEALGLVTTALLQLLCDQRGLDAETFLMRIKDNN